MKLRTKYILLVSILHLVMLVLSFFIFRDNQVIFICSEVLIIISIWIAIRLYFQLIQPLRLLMQGIDAIQDRDFNVKFIKTGQFEMDQLILVYNNMIDELRAERTKQEQQHFFLEKLIYTSPTGILILDYEEKIHLANPKALQLLNLDQEIITGKYLADLSHPVLQLIQEIKPGEARMITLNGVDTYKLQKSQFIDRGFPRHFVMIEELTEEILAAEKKAYGKVIRMMAHEVNNTIGPVNSILQSASNARDIWLQEKYLPILNALQTAIDRNQNLNLFMRNFAEVVRLPEPVKKNIDLHSIIYAVGKLMETRAAEKGITFRYDLLLIPYFILADSMQMEQVLINIVKNAIEAIESHGTITFLTNGSGELKIVDTGQGITADVSAQLFSPFFSTKRDGQGIGLTVIREILLNHGFRFSLETTSPGNTVFTIHT